jgi:hypothetical protein
MWSLIGQSKTSVDVDGDNKAEEEAETIQHPEGYIFPDWTAPFLSCSKSPNVKSGR